MKVFILKEFKDQDNEYKLGGFFAVEESFGNQLIREGYAEKYLGELSDTTRANRLEYKKVNVEKYPTKMSLEKWIKKSIDYWFIFGFIWFIIPFLPHAATGYNPIGFTFNSSSNAFISIFIEFMFVSQIVWMISATNFLRTKRLIHKKQLFWTSCCSLNVVTAVLIKVQQYVKPLNNSQDLAHEELIKLED